MIHDIEINGKTIKIMEQPAKYVLNLERKFSDKEVIGYVKEILKYPAEQNPKIEDIISIPKEIKVGNVTLSLEKNGEIDLHLVERLFFSINENKPNPAYLGEKVLTLANLDVANYKYKDLVEIGTEAFTQIGEFAHLITIREFFRNI